MEREKLHAKEISKYANKWVALVDYKVVASGNTLQEVKEAVEKKKVKQYVFHLVPVVLKNTADSISLQNLRLGGDWAEL